MSTYKRLQLVRLPEPSARPITSPNPTDVDVLDQLRKLGALRTVGILTQEDYEAKSVELRALL
jgi:hypothetical protein